MALISLGCECEPDCPPINGTPGPPGPRGRTGVQGIPGIDGLNAFGITTAPFTVPDVGASVTVEVNPAQWATPQQVVYVMEVGYFEVAVVSQLLVMWLTNLGYPHNLRPGTLVATGRQVSPAGIRGEQGLRGFQGEIGLQGKRGKRGKHGKPGPRGERGLTGPPGPSGPPGAGLYFKGKVADEAALPNTGNKASDCYITTDTGHAWIWNGNSWVDIGPLAVGPPGQDGLQGPAGPPGRRGSFWFTGSGPPADPPPVNALPQDLYLDVTNGDIWVVIGTRFVRVVR